MIEKTIDADGTTHVTMSLEMVSVTLPAVELKRISDETERLRELIRAVVEHGPPRDPDETAEADTCGWCGGTYDNHISCTWPALVAEAEKP